MNKLYNPRDRSLSKNKMTSKLGSVTNNTNSKEINPYTSPKSTT